MWKYGVVTLNIVRLAYLSSSSKEDFFKRLDNLSDVALRSFEVKRQVLNQLLEAGLYPYTKAYISDFNDHYGTLGIVGMNEACLNAKWLKKNLMDLDAQTFSMEVLEFLNHKLLNQSQKVNLEATPAESVCTHFAQIDKELYPEIQSHGYYTNSTHLDVASTDDVFEALHIQQDFQNQYSGATSFPVFIDHGIEDWKMAALLVKTIYENYEVPVFTITPTYSVCEEHGYLLGHQDICPKCSKSTEVYSRVSGYYRNLEDWNEGKQKRVFKKERHIRFKEGYYARNNRFYWCFGNMGKAMIEGICQNHVFNTVWVCDHHQENLDVLHEKYGVETSLDEKK